MSWFPKISPDGTRVIGGAKELWKGGVKTPTKGFAPTWLNNDEVIFGVTVGEDRSKLVKAPYGNLEDQTTLFETSAGSQRQGYNGAWAVSFKDGVKFSSLDEPIKNAGLGGIAWLGWIYVAPFAEVVKGLFLNGKQIHKGRMRDVAVGHDAIVWLDGATVKAYYDGAVKTEPVLNVWRGRPIPLQDKWILANTNKGHVVWKRGTTRGFYTDTKEQSYYPDGFVQGNTIKVVCTTESGEFKEYKYQVGSEIDLKNVWETEPPPPPEEKDTMEMTREEFELLQRYAKAYPPPQAEESNKAHQDACRQWTRRAAEQFEFTFLTPEYGHKSSNPTSDPSKDAIVKRIDGRMFYIDTLLGAGTGKPRVISSPGTWKDITGQHFIKVDPINHLAPPVVVTPPPPVVVPPPPVEVKPVINIEVKLDAVAAELAKLDARFEQVVNKLDDVMKAVQQGIVDVKQHRFKVGL